AYVLIHKKRTTAQPFVHRVIPSLSTAALQSFHYPNEFAVVTCLSRMRGTRHPETGPKRPSDPPRPCQARVAAATAAQGHADPGYSGTTKPDLPSESDHSFGGDAARRR